MDKIKQFIMIDCYAFTSVSMLNGIVLSLSNNHSVPITFVLPIFGVSSMIALLIVITSSIFSEQLIINRILRAVDILVPVLVYDILTQKSALTLKNIISEVIVCLLIGAIVGVMMLVSWKEKDNKANESLVKMRNRRKNR